MDAILDSHATAWSVLASTIVSLRTKDEVTLAASNRLLAAAPDPASTAALSEEAVAGLIYPAGFYRTKARNLKATAAVVLERHGGEVPGEYGALAALPGVGPKTANLVLSLAFGVPAICVDVHVHRIANRRGWTETRTPGETEEALKGILPERWWIPLNALLVAFGRSVCTPLSPWCSRCPASEACPRRGVPRSR